MLRLKGIPAARGLARGSALIWHNRQLEIPHYKSEDPESEKGRLAEARSRARAQLAELASKVAREAGAAEAAVFEAHAMFLQDQALVDKAEALINEGANAEWAWQQAVEHFARQLENLPDETLRARAVDVRDVGRRVLETLLGAQTSRAIPNGSVIVARDLAPSQTAALDKSKVVAFCIAEGGPTSHTAILAKALNIPAVVGLGESLLGLAAGNELLVDGTNGEVLVNPNAATLTDFENRRMADVKEGKRAVSQAGAAAVTKDGRQIEIAANVGSLEDARLALTNGAEGIGLLRTEFLFLNRTTSPDEDTQHTAYRAILDMMGERPVVARTLDIGGDKEVPYYDFGPEANPFLGYRAIRISLDRPEDFKIQLRALLRAGRGHRLRIMFPMIATLQEVRRARELVEEARRELASRGEETPDLPELGIMVEIPATALLADKFAPEVDFFSIGTNDLTQYTFAAERGNKRVSGLNDACHPALLREIQMVAEAAHRSGHWAGICGELGGDLEAIPVLLGLGMDELSMAPGLIPAAKQVIRQWSMREAEALARTTLDLDSSEAVRDCLKKNKKPG